jgi:predicted nuclease of predicted toxin-antitoxin system
MTWTDIAQLVAANPPTPREIAEVYANIRRRAKARFYADENFPTRATHILRAMRARVRTAQEAHLLGRSDEDHLAYARREESILLTCDRDFLDERRFPLVHSPVLFVFDFGSGSEYEIRLAFRCLKTVLQMPQFFDKWWNIDAGRHGWTETVRHLNGGTSRHRYRLSAGKLQEWC